MASLYACILESPFPHHYSSDVKPLLGVKTCVILEYSSGFVQSKQPLSVASLSSCFLLFDLVQVRHWLSQER